MTSPLTNIKETGFGVIQHLIPVGIGTTLSYNHKTKGATHLVDGTHTFTEVAMFFDGSNDG